jgi:hypothetical protein
MRSKHVLDREPRRGGHRSNVFGIINPNVFDAIIVHIFNHRGGPTVVSRKPITETPTIPEIANKDTAWSKNSREFCDSPGGITITEHFTNTHDGPKLSAIEWKLLNVGTNCPAMV